MIHLTSGNLLEADAEALVNTVNTVGVMGKGIALMVKEAYPENFRAYAEACKRGDVRSPTERGHEFERMRTAIRRNADSVSRERGHFGGFVGTVSTIVVTVSTIVGTVSTIVGIAV